MLKRIGAEEGGEFKAVASGTLPSGQPVVVNADGTVSAIARSDTTSGTVVQFESGNMQKPRSAYMTNVDRVVIAYADLGNSYYGTAVVGTVSGTSISFGTPVVFNSAQSNGSMSIVFDDNAGKVVISYQDGGTNQGESVVGTVNSSDNSISFGSTATFIGNDFSQLVAAYDTNSNKVFLVCRDSTISNKNVGTVGTVSGTSISFGSNLKVSDHVPSRTNVVFDSNANKFLIIYYDSGDSNKGKSVVATIADSSATTATYGSEVTFHDASTDWMGASFDSDTNKILVAYEDVGDSNKGKAVVGTISGTSISYGSEVEFRSDTDGLDQIGAVYDTNLDAHIITYFNNQTPRYIETVAGQISGTTATFSTPVVLTNSITDEISHPTFDPDTNKVIVAYRDDDDSGKGKAVVLTPGLGSNLTSENYIGMSRGVAFQSPVTEGVGSAVQYKAASFAYGPLVFDSNANKTVFAYPDAGDSNKGKAKVATVSGTSISFGSEATFTTNHCDQLESVFDSSNNKVVIVYRDQDNSSYGTAVVGTVSGTSITFGSPVVFNSANSFWFGVAFDSTNNKIVIAYRDIGNSSYGTAIVGTVSGTSISFGSETTFESATSVRNQLVYDTTNQKIVVAYINGSTSGPLQSRVGTVSGTSISFGSEVTIDSDTCFEPQLVFNPDTGTVIVIYYNSTDGNGTSKIGTVSGTSISFSSETVFNSGGTSDMDVVYDSNAQKIVVTYKKSDADGFIKVGTVGASSISYGTELEFADYDISYTNSAFDSNLNKVVIGFADLSNSNYGTAIVFQNTGTETIRGQVTNGQAASVDVIGSVSDNQIGLTAGQQYFVQTDGTISTTAGTPSVLAGTAISATELVVKT